jgi:RNA polymerase primary sigma factor
MSALFNQYKNYLYKSARKVSKRYPSVELDELISEGFEGILRALEKYDCNESSFLTYAQHWVRMKMFNAARKSIGLMTLPGSMYALISKVKRALDEDPSLSYKSLARLLGQREERIAIVLNIIKSPKGGGMATTLEEYVTYEDNLGEDAFHQADNLESATVQSDFQEKFWTVVERVVSVKEFFVLELLFGRGGEMRRSLEWVAKVLLISKERVRQIRECAFAKLVDDEEFLELVSAEDEQLFDNFEFPEETESPDLQVLEPDK